MEAALCQLSASLPIAVGFHYLENLNFSAKHKEVMGKDSLSLWHELAQDRARIVEIKKSGKIKYESVIYRFIVTLRPSFHLVYV